MLAAPAKAIARLAQYRVNEISYCVSEVSMRINKITLKNKLMQSCFNGQSILISLLQH